MSSSSSTSANIASNSAFTPHSSTSSINVEHSNTSNLKRRRQDGDGSQSHSEPFEVRSVSSSEILCYAYPCCTLSRARLPLAFLDFSQHSPNLIPRIFASAIDSLEDENVLRSQDHIVLIAKVGKERALYAIERLEQNVYSGSRLLNWATWDTLKTLLQQPPRTLHKKPCISTQSSTREWWSSIIIEQSSEVHSNKSIKLESDDDVTASHRDTTDAQAVAGSGLPSPTEQPRQDMPDVAAQLPLLRNDTTRTESVMNMEDSITSVSTNYLEMLYTSRAPLAYFVKGPLSRARAAYNIAGAQSNHLQELVDSLRLLILSISALDKKYKESIPTTIKTLASAGTSLEKPKTAKRKKSRKFKPGKDGLFPDEVDSIGQWWVRDMTGSTLSPTAESLQAAMKTRITGLRLREYLLQLVLILEVIAIETTITKANSKAQQTTHDMQATTEDSQVPETEIPAKTAKKPRDLQPLVETIIDRLQIWQSVSSVELDNPVEESEHTRNGVNVDAAADETARDELKEFCVEVVVPFYASRLGKVAERIARKLGVQTAPSPVKRKSAQKDPPARPGAALSREDPSKPRRSLHRVSTIGGRSVSGQPPTLMRSATDTLLQEIARERSNSPIVKSTTGGAGRSFSRSSSINHGKKVNQREVEMNLYAKSGKDKVAETELQEAIATLRKPNRGLAVKELVDAADTRKTMATQKRGTIARTHSQVVATPKRSTKTQNVVSATPSRATTQANVYLDENPFVASATSFVPSSGLRPASPARGHDQAPHVSGPSISETPSKPGGRYLDSLGIMHNGNTTRERSPIPAPPIFKAPPARKVSWHDQSNAAQVAETPRKVRAGGSIGARPGYGEGRERIASPELEAVMSSPVMERKSIANEKAEIPAGSIYDSLGWDDEDIL